MRELILTKILYTVVLSICDGKYFILTSGPADGFKRCASQWDITFNDKKLIIILRVFPKSYEHSEFSAALQDMCILILAPDLENSSKYLHIKNLIEKFSTVGHD